MNRNTIPAAVYPQNSVKIWTYSSSRSSKVDDFGTNQKCIHEFLFVINSNFDPILHHFWDTATYWLKIAHFLHPSLIRCPRSQSSLSNFMARLSVRKLRVMGLLCGEGCVILTSTGFDWSTRVTDWWTDGRCRALKINAICSGKLHPDNNSAPSSVSHHFYACFLFVWAQGHLACKKSYSNIT